MNKNTMVFKMGKFSFSRCNFLEMSSNEVVYRPPQPDETDSSGV